MKPAAKPGYVFWLLTTFVPFGFASATDVGDDEFQLSGTVAIASDYVFRGISQTLGSPALQASLDLEIDNGFYAYVWGSNVDFYPDSEPDDGARTEFNIAAGYAAELGDRWSVDVLIVRYLFPGTNAAIDYDYSELITTVSFDDRLRATLGYSNSVDGTGADSLFSEFGYRFDLPSAFAFDVAYGYYDLSNAYGAEYDYVSAVLSRTFGEAQASLSYYGAFGGADQIFYEQAIDTRLVFSLLVNF